MPSSSNSEPTFAQALSQWAGQCNKDSAHKDHHDEANVDDLTVANFHPNTGALHIEGLPSHNAVHLQQLHKVLHHHGHLDRVQVLEMARCHLGGTITAPLLRSEAEQAQVVRNDSSSLSALAQLLRSLPNLQSLDLSSNLIDNQALCIILEAVSQHSQLRQIILEDNAIRGRTAGLALSAYLLHQHMHAKALRVLNLGENNLAREGALLLAPALARYGKLEKLNLACNGIDDEPTFSSDAGYRSVFRVLADSFLANPALRELTWSVGEMRAVYQLDQGGSSIDTPSSEQGILAVAYLLENHSSLQSLSILQSPDFMCPHQPVVANERLCRALAKSPTLERFVLEGCGICDETMAMFCKQVLLRHNPVFQHLDLLSNDLGSVGHEHLFATLPQLKYLRSLALEGTTLEQPREFLTAMAKNTSLTHVRVLDTPEVDITTQVDNYTLRNDIMLCSNSLLNEHGSDAVVGQALVRCAAEPCGVSAVYQILQQKLLFGSSSPSRASCSSSNDNKHLINDKNSNNGTRCKRRRLV